MASESPESSFLSRYLNNQTGPARATANWRRVAAPQRVRVIRRSARLAPHAKLERNSETERAAVPTSLEERLGYSFQHRCQSDFKLTLHKSLLRQYKAPAVSDFSYSIAYAADGWAAPARRPARRRNEQHAHRQKAKQTQQTSHRRLCGKIQTLGTDGKSKASSTKWRGKRSLTRAVSGLRGYIRAAARRPAVDQPPTLPPCRTRLPPPQRPHAPVSTPVAPSPPPPPPPEPRSPSDWPAEVSSPHPQGSAAALQSPTPAA